MEILTPPATLHPEELQLDELLNQLTKIELLLYWRFRRWLKAKQRRGEMPYVCPARRWIAEQLVCCSIRTVTRALAHFNELGLLVIKQRFRAVPGRRRGRLRRQLTNLIALPLTRPRNERDRAVPHTRRHKKKISNKVASGLSSRHKRASVTPSNGFVSAQTILERWAKRGKGGDEPEPAGQS